MAPLHNLAIEMLALTVLGIVAWQRGQTTGTRGERLALALLLLIVLTPLLQLVPLPPPVWGGLPGRELAVEVDTFLGAPRGWRPLSLDPEATELAAAYLLAPAAMFVAVLRLGERERDRLAHILVAASFLSLGLAAVQIAAGDGAVRLYDGSHRAFGTGLFANRNHQVDLLLIGMVFTSVLIWRRPDLAPAVRWGLWLGIILAFSAGVIATASRTGFLLLPFVVLASASFIPSAVLRRHRASLLWSGAAAAVALALVATSAGTQQVLRRFETVSEGRFEFWSDTWLVARQYMPWGSGIGTFDPVYRAVEDLNRMGARYLNHAHNDYIQILIEAGLWGGLLILLFIGLFGWLWARRGVRVPWRTAAAFSILILLLHSLADYPLRMLSLLTLFGFLCALFFPVRGAARGEATPPKAV